MDTTNWKWFYIEEIFDVNAGKYHYKDEYEKGSTPYLSATASNNGVGERINLEPEFEGGIVTTEKVCCTSFYQPNPFCATSDVNIIRMKDGSFMNQYVGLFLATIIDFNESFRWTYGRQCRVNDTKKIRLKLPVTPEGTPDWQYMEDFVKDRIIPQLPKKAQKVWLKKYDISPMKQDKKSLHTETWKSFELKDLFIINRGKTLTADDKEYYSGNIPCVNGTSTDNGVLCYLNDGIEAKGFKKQPIPSLSLCRVGSSGLTFVQNKPYYIADNAFCLQLKTQQNIYAYLFISTLLDKECIKYCYGRTISSEKYMQTRIKLPVTPSGTPDWKFMEDYIKSLPFSKNLEPSDPKEVVDELVEMKKEMIKMRRALEAQQSPSNLVNYGTVNIYEKQKNANQLNIYLHSSKKSSNFAASQTPRR